MSGSLPAMPLLFLAAFAVSAGLVELARRWSIHRQILDRPNERSSHSAATPRGGGIAIVAVTLGGLLLVNAFHPLFRAGVLTAITASGFAVAAISWLDDVRGVSAVLRLSVHLAAAAAVTMIAGAIPAFWIPYAGAVPLGALAIVLTILWISGLTNAFNFMDGIDGLAAMQSVLAGLGWLVLGFLGAGRGPAIAGGLLAASAFAFLLRNWQPSRVFLGDVGSAFLGFMLASLTVVAAQEHPRLTSAGALLVWPFVFDSGLTLVWRMTRGERLFRAHRTHLYQRAVQSGMSHASVALVYGACGLTGLAAAIALAIGRAPLAAVGLVIAAAVGLWLFVQRR